MDQSIVSSAGASLLLGLEEIPSISLTVPMSDLKLIYETREYQYAVPQYGRDYPLSSIEVLVKDDPLFITTGTLCGLTGHSDVELKRSFYVEFGSEYGESPWYNPMLEDFPRGRAM